MKTSLIGFFLSLLSVPAMAITIGAAAPDFSLPGADGKTYSLAQFKGKVVVLEWFNKDCPYVRKHYESKNMQKLQAEATSKGTVWLAIVSSAAGKEGHMDAATAMKTMTDQGMAATAILFDADGKLGKAYGAKTTPHMYVVGKDGKLAYQGAIDDDQALPLRPSKEHRIMCAQR